MDAWPEEPCVAGSSPALGTVRNRPEIAGLFGRGVGPCVALDHSLPKGTPERSLEGHRVSVSTDGLKTDRVFLPASMRLHYIQACSVDFRRWRACPTDRDAVFQAHRSRFVL